MDDINRALSTPSSAGSSVSGCAKSPCTISTFGKLDNVPAFSVVRTTVRQETLRCDNNFTISTPFVPVAPVIKIMILPQVVSRILHQHYTSISLLRVMRLHRL